MLDYYKDIQVKNIVFKLKSNMKQAYTRYEYFAINKKQNTFIVQVIEAQKNIIFKKKINYIQMIWIKILKII